jgi:hypothetical protein
MLIVVMLSLVAPSMAESYKTSICVISNLDLKIIFKFTSIREMFKNTFRVVTFIFVVKISL